MFIEQFGTDNPANAIDLYGKSIPALVDIDGDGDLDLFVGETYQQDASIHYYENTGTLDKAVFTERTGSANPLGSFAINAQPSLDFADIDGDGDADLFMGHQVGLIKFYRNDTPLQPEETDFPWSMFLPAIIGEKQ